MIRPTFRTSLASGAVALLLLSCGCYGQRLSSLEVRTARMEDRLAEIDRMNREMSVTLAALQKLVGEEVEQARAGRAGNAERLTEIQQLLQVLSTRVDESGEHYRELKDVVRYTPAGRDSAAASDVTPRSLYDAAYSDLTRGNHGLAILGFQEVLTKFPESELADNAQYWIGECYYAQKDYRQALAEFRKTVENYPGGDKVPAALLKEGLCEAALGDAKAARATLEDLQRRFPQTEEARLAGQKIQEL
jgi:tol-pal system protein YbgF